VNWNKFLELAYTRVGWIYQRIDHHIDFPQYIPSGRQFIRKDIHRSIHIRQYFVANFMKFFLFRIFYFTNMSKKESGAHPKCTKLLLPILNSRKKIWKQSTGISQKTILRKSIYRSITKTIFCCKFPEIFSFQDFFISPMCLKKSPGAHSKCTKLLLPILNRRQKIWKQSIGISQRKVMFTELLVIVITEIEIF